jgi:hypothetical protein
MSENQPAQDPVVTFRHHEEALMKRLKSAESVLVQGMNLFEAGYPFVNEALITAGRPDLVITQPAAMMPVEKPDGIFEHCNNFSPGFMFITGRRPTGELSWNEEPIMEKIIATPEEVLALRAVPRILSLDETHDLRQDGEFAALFSLICHGRRAAFTRMINLFPDFTSNFAVEFSTANAAEKNFGRHETELFVAYQLMSRLVDAGDLDVIRDGEVDDWHLCR